jgi:hypothetical protein
LRCPRARVVAEIGEVAGQRRGVVAGRLEVISGDDLVAVPIDGDFGRLRAGDRRARKQDDPS